MWICMNDSFISAVQDSANKDMLYVRSRKREHLVILLKKTGVTADIVYTKTRDYQFRIHIPKIVFAQMLPVIVMGIDYTNFKNSVKESELKMFYSDTWSKGVKYLDNRTDDEFWADQLGVYYGEPKKSR